MQTITENEVASLAQWQQDLLNDPGWKQPPIPQVAETPMPAPTGPITERTTSYLKRHLSRGTSAADPVQGEYDLPCGSTVGCDGGCNGNHALDKWISEADIPDDTPYAITYVDKFVSWSNYFNISGGSSNNSLCAVYQVFSNKAQADKDKKFCEASYRADGGPGSGGDPCNANKAYVVKGFIWWKYNSQTFDALPGGNETPLYNLLIAPSSDESDPQTNAGATTATYQSFYMGSLNEALYGGAQMVSIQSTTSSCDKFRNSVTGSRYAFTNPIYGVLLKRWQDGVVKSMQAPNNNPWNTDFGWPIIGPVAYNNGAQTLTAKGAYYAWGMYFERGFVWWIDYINNANVPDEAQAYSFSGDNVLCKTPDAAFEKLPTIYYGGTGPLGVCVVVEASLNPDRGPDAPTPGTYYEVSIPYPQSTPLQLDLHAHGFGGTPDNAGHYKYYTWAFRDGTIGLTNGVAFDDSTKYVQHAYAQAANYTVRVQTVDANGVIAYGDSLPIHVNWGGGAN